MSLVGQVDWYFQVTVCARETCGMAMVAAPATRGAGKKLAARGRLGRAGLI